MNSVKYSKQGFATVYIVICLSTIMFFLIVVLEASSSLGAESIAQSSFNLGGRSLLGQYNKELFKRYGIFALRNYEDEMDSLAEHYIGDSLKATKTVIHLSLDSVDVDFDSYPALNTKLLAESIDKIAIGSLVKKSNNSEVSHKDLSGLILPSKLLGYKSREIVSLSGGLLDVSLMSLLEDEYILKMTSNHIDGLSDSYLALETEYILYGYSSDDANLASIRRSIYAVRYAANLANASPLPTEAVALAAALVKVAVQTEKDVNDIADGKTVDGWNYESYLRAFLKLLDTDEKMARLMDIMQINLQMMDGSSFYFANYAYGFDMTAKFSKKVYIPDYFGFSSRYGEFSQSFVYN